MKKNICIIGAGNIGVACAFDISLNDNYSVTIFSKRANTLPSKFTKINSLDNTEKESNPIIVTNDEEIAFKNAEIILVTVPSFMTDTVVKQILPYSPKIVFYIPGYGGKELFSKPLVDKNIIIAGLERVPYIARLKNETTVCATKKPDLSCSALKSRDTEYACQLLEDMFNITCNRINSYLTISFTPSNPILHTARLYSMFKDYDFNSYLQSQILFYAAWDDNSSEVLIGMDKELEAVCNAFSEIDLSQFKTIRTHYESFDIKAMTNKISNIPAFKNIYSPLKKIDNKELYIIDSESRYFQEDFPYGLCILKGFADIVNIQTPYMNKVLKWFEKISKRKVLSPDEHVLLSDIDYTGIPQRFGLTDKQDVIKFYK